MPSTLVYDQNMYRLRPTSIANDISQCCLYAVEIPMQNSSRFESAQCACRGGKIRFPMRNGDIEPRQPMRARHARCG